MDSEICDGLTHGMYLTLCGILKEIGMADRLVSAERIVSALRERKTREEIASIKDAVARRIVVDAGYAEFPHALGHQVGRFPHDGTALLGPPWDKYAQKPFRRLEEGMVFTIEPRLAVPGRGVVTIEDMVVVTGDGADGLSTPQTELILIR